MQFVHFAFLCLAFAPAIGCADDNLEDKVPEVARKALAEGGTIELFALSPKHLEAPIDDQQRAKRFNNWQILGTTKLDAQETRAPLLAAFFAGVNENDGTVANCFNPRHGLRVTQEDKVYEFVICFECYQVQWFIDSERQEGFLITDSPAELFNETLKDAGVSVAGNK